MADKKKILVKKWLTALLAIVLAVSLANYYANPSEQSVAVGQPIDLSASCPASLAEYVTANNGQVEKQLTESLNAQDSPGEMSISLKLFGLIPYKQVNVSVVEEKYLYPGGQSIGVLLRTQGVLVVGSSPIIAANGKEVNPAEESGIELGDIIVKVNDQTVITDDQLAELVNDCGAKGEEIVLTINRAQSEKKIKIAPVFCTESQKWRIGLLVRDNAGGVGTLSFIDPQSGSYGALGHMVSENNTGEMLDISMGKLIKADIEDIVKSERGTPGEKVGSFVNNDALGSITKNTECGIFGKISDWDILGENIVTQPMPVGLSSDIQYGEAEILTVLEGDKVESFAVEIMKIMPNGKTGKELVIKVTDERLLEKTGGIVQGMSGSPIIQNGKIIGAVTYVFVNDPTKGYGILIEDMLEEAGLMN